MNGVGPSRRGLIAASAGFGGLALAGCDRLSASSRAQALIGGAQALTMDAQRLLLSGQPLAKEYPPSAISRVFKPNGTTMPSDPDYQAMLRDGFGSWRLAVGGLVERPLSLSLSDLKALPTRTQITRHDCVEGWSCIGEWTGVQLSRILARSGVARGAKFVVFRCADNLGATLDLPGQYYESIDFFDAFHPQTILAWAMNGAPLDAAHGAPLRLRLERQLGYKMAKYVMRIDLVASFQNIAGGKGGYWEDRGYQWYAGI
ncbi:MAG: molybdopterin-dependent oxidoreductase [Caulobacteraceae bacterium]